MLFWRNLVVLVRLRQKFMQFSGAISVFALTLFSTYPAIFSTFASY